VNDADRLQRDELRAVIDEEVDRLGDAQRLPVVLCCLEGLSHEAAAHRIDWPVGTEKSRLARASAVAGPALASWVCAGRGGWRYGPAWQRGVGRRRPGPG
jgi:hypothetical protein